MARYCSHDVEAVLDAAAQWRNNCLIEDGSVFTSEHIWVAEGAQELYEYFTLNEDTGDKSFMNKLEGQLRPSKPTTKKLAAEMLWLIFLFQTKKSIKGKNKREQIREVWSWSGDVLDEHHPMLGAPLEEGVGNPGAAYQTQRWAQFRYLIEVLRELKKRNTQERRDTLAEAWSFAGWLDGISKKDNPQLRHIIKYLVFPEYFERIASDTQKRRIVAEFHKKDIKQVNKLSLLDVDKELYSIRQEQETKYKTNELDFYLSPLIEVWRMKKNIPLPDNITREDILNAIRSVDRDGIDPQARSSTYDLIYKGKRYPPKYVLAQANKYANKKELDRSTFGGGEDTQTFSILRNLGFVIEKKDYVPTLLRQFIEQADKEEDLSTSSYPKAFCGMSVKVSFGQGVFSHIPWVSFTGYGQTTSDGIYPVYLYYRSVGVLILAYGVSETKKPDATWTKTENKISVKDHLLNKYDHDPKRYGASYVFSSYDFSKDLSDEQLTKDLDAIIAEYQDLMETEPTPVVASRGKSPAKPILDPAAMANSFSDALKNSNVDFGAEHNQRIQAFIASLLTKPFVILTGLSGSGKTQIAIRFGEWLGADRLYVAAVRPDWTGAEALFGYEDALRPSAEGRAAWALPSPLKFLLKAVEDPQNPYVLLLDEMNLAHVERYFADVLSGMESGQPCLPNLVCESDGNWRLKPNAPEQVIFPNNVFVIGTVNVDETTYMFSPKVLDRANTFEFRVRTEDLVGNYNKPVQCEEGGLGLAQGFLEIARNFDWHKDQPYSKEKDLSGYLREVHQILSPHGFEFGHRVYYESQRFASMYGAAGATSVEEVLDRILIQKILPRLHGSRRRLEVLMKGLAQFCFDLSMPSDEKGSHAMTFDPDDKEIADSALPISFHKLSRMLRGLRANQFTSFTE